MVLKENNVSMVTKDKNIFDVILVKYHPLSFRTESNMLSQIVLR